MRSRVVSPLFASPLAVAAALAAAVPADAVPGQTKTVEEVLKEKGVITEAEYDQIAGTKASPRGTVAYTPGKGFTFDSPDGRFRLALGGRIQVRYTYIDRDEANGPAQEVSEWRVRRMKVYLGGHAHSKELTYRVQVDLANGGSARILDDAWINYRFAEQAQLAGGQFKIPFARGEITSDGALQFIERAAPVDAFKPSYDTGVMAHGKVAGGLVAYNTGAFGGAGQSTSRTTNSGALAARLTFNPFGEVTYSEADLDDTGRPLLSVGVNGFANTLRKAGGAAFEGAPPPYA